MTPRFAPLALAAAIALAPAGSARALTPSPADWRDVVLYQVITDRFANGRPANDALEGQFAPADGARIHGGDFAGIVAKLGYLEHLGVDGVWISPVPLNANAEYHGYAARDPYAIAPHFGTLAELRALADSLHARGMVLVLDVVVNHMGDLVDSGSPGYPSFIAGGSYALRWKNAAVRHAGFFDDLSRYHANGGIQSFVDPDQVLGELFSLDDLKTEDPVVRDELVRMATFLIDSTDCDGFRLDTVKHVEMGFWQSWAPAVHAAAAARGKERFFLFGEVFDGSDAKCASYTGTVGGGPYKLDSVVDYPLYFVTNGVFGGSGWPSDVANRWANLPLYDTTSREQLVTFLDNHDNSRFLGFGVANQDESRARAAIAFLLTARGVPCLYYGTEQEFDGGGDPWCREDMWDGQWDFGPSEGDNFDLAHPLFQWTRAWTDHRRRHPSLRRGATTVLAAASGGPGVLAYQRIAPGDTTVVALNTSNETVVVTLAGPWPAGTSLVVWSGDLTPRAEIAAGVGGALAMSLPPRAAWLLAREGAAAARTHLDVVAAWPGHDQTVSDLASPLRLRFATPPDAGALAAGFTLVPPLPGSWVVTGDLARYFPTGGWPANTAFAWRLDPSVHDVEGRPLRDAYDAIFRTGSGAAGIVVPGGYRVDRIAQQGLTAPEALAAPASGDRLLLSDTGRDRVFTLTPGGDLGHAMGDARWTRAEGLATAAGAGEAIVTDPAGVFAISDTASRRIVSGGAATSRGACARSAAGEVFVGDPSGDRVARVVGGVLQTFASGVRGAEGLAFAPGGAWGTDLYAADANLTSLGSSGTASDGTGRLVRLAANGAVTTVVQHALLAGACGLAFDASGRFGGDLFVADVLAERILRVTSAGAVSVFATGFKNLASSCALAFGPDDALYVADPGSAQSFSNTSGSGQPCAVYRIAAQNLPVAVPPFARAPVALSVAPNPAATDVALRFTLASAGAVRLEVLDAAGRRVRVLADGWLAAGDQRRIWDGRDDSGRAAAPGLYLARLRSPAGEDVRRFVRLR